MRIHSSFSSMPIEVKGRWHISGPQETEMPNGAPKWLEVVFADKRVLAVTVEWKEGGVSYTRIVKRDEVKP